MSEELLCEVPGCPRPGPYEPGRSWEGHRRRHRNEERRVPCEHCGERLLGGNMHRHLKMVHKVDHQVEIPEVNIQTILDLQQQLADKDRQLEEKDAEIARVDGLRQRYYDNWTTGKPFKGKR